MIRIWIGVLLYFWCFTVCWEFLWKLVMQSVWGCISAWERESLVDWTGLYNTPLATDSIPGNSDVWDHSWYMGCGADVWECLHQILGCRSHSFGYLRLFAVSIICLMFFWSVNSLLWFFTQHFLLCIFQNVYFWQRYEEM